MRFRAATVAAAAALATGLGLFASTALASSDTYRSGPLTATFSAGTSRPNCKQLWPVTVTARENGKYVHATAYYQFLYHGQVVGTVQVFSHTKKNPHNRLYHFYGRFYDNTFGPFGALSVGLRINVRAVVQVGRYKAYPGVYVTVTNTRGCRAVTSG